MSRYAASSQLTAASRRVVERCRQLVDADQDADVWAGHLVLTLLLDESLASACLKRLGITRPWLQAGHLGDDVATTAAMLALAEGESLTDLPAAHADGDGMSGSGATVPRVSAESLATGQTSVRQPTDPPGLTSILDRAVAISRRTMAENGVSSSHLLLAIVEMNGFIQNKFQSAGISSVDLRNELGVEPDQSSARLPVEITLAGSDSSSATPSAEQFESERGKHTAADIAFPASDQPAVWRLIDANLNRSREGLRVLEDHARFLLNDASRSRQLKELRHDLVAAERLLPDGMRASLQHRDTSGDVGTSITLPGEILRGSPGDVVVANCRRVQESLRSLEEFGKLLSGPFAAAVKQFRYRLYELQTHWDEAGQGQDHTANSAAMSLAEKRRRRLQSARLYVLITEEVCRQNWQTVAESCLAGGADILQLREKHLNDRELLRRARWLTSACQAADALCIINDRADVAAAAGADGLHVGQQELSVADARTILNPQQLAGVSTHTLQQFEEAGRSGADYAGVGPTFSSSTKHFSQFAGLDFIRQVSEIHPTARPWFAIGGIDLSNVHQVVQAGCRRVAVTAAVVAADNPGEMCRALRDRLVSLAENTASTPASERSSPDEDRTSEQSSGSSSERIAGAE